MVAIIFKARAQTFMTVRDKLTRDIFLMYQITQIVYVLAFLT